MILIFTGYDELDKDLEKRIDNSRVVYYPDYILEETEADILITTPQPNKYNFNEFMYKVRKKDIRVILLLENEKSKVLSNALIMGIYDILFNEFSIEDIEKLLKNPTPFSYISKYIVSLLSD